MQPQATARAQARDLPPAPRDFSTSQLRLMRRSLAQACTDAEFDEFIAVAASCGLDPLRKQITPLLLNADDPTRRRLLVWTTVDGLRVIAARQGNYRPMETAPLIERNDACVDEKANPLGIVRAEVKAWRRSGKDWHPVVGEAWWNEFAPLREEWAADDLGVRSPTGNMTLDASWRRMGRVMIAKCAEAQALRRGWPDLLSGLYGEEELQAARLADNTASEVLRQSEDARRRSQLERRSLWFVFDQVRGLEPVRFADVESTVRAFYQSARDIETIHHFEDANRLNLQTYWQWAPIEAYALKQLREVRERALGKGKAASSPQDVCTLLADAPERGGEREV